MLPVSFVSLHLSCIARRILETVLLALSLAQSTRPSPIDARINISFVTVRRSDNEIAGPLPGLAWVLGNRKELRFGTVGGLGIPLNDAVKRGVTRC